jgi:diaminopimelate epimerase
MHFEKIHACGNDFLLLNETPNRKQIAEMCKRHHSMGADGIMTWSQSESGTQLEHFDPDGSFSFCLNGTRATIGCLHTQGLLPDRGIVTLGSRQIPYHVQETPVLYLEKAPFAERNITIGEHLFRGYFVEVGNPHFILIEEDPECFRLSAAKIRSHPAFLQGSNVHLVVRNCEEWSIFSYERGVEDFTLSCGSGALAVACLFFQKNQMESLTLHPEGGGTIQFEARGPLVALHGEVTWVGGGELRC